MIKLNEISTRAPEDLDKDKAKKELEEIVEELEDLQNLMYAEHKHSVLVILQGMDASGKDGLIRTVFGQLNPQGVQVASFKVPTSDELDHDFLWRIHKKTPAKGMIQIFNRSQYEDVLVTRVEGIINDNTAKQRMQAINDFERMLEHNNTHILKCYLHVSAEEQRERLTERMHDPKKMWKYSPDDFGKADKRDVYVKYYEEVFAKCNEVPWHIIPADQNWCKAYMVASKLRDMLRGLDMKYPRL